MKEVTPVQEKKATKWSEILADIEEWERKRQLRKNKLTKK